METKRNPLWLRVLAVVLMTCAVNFIPVAPSAAQSSAGLEQLAGADSATLNALVLYPDSTRHAVLEAAQHSDVLVQMKALRDSMQRRFNASVAPYSQVQQEAIWNLTRYPELLNQITSGGKKKRSELKSIAENYPEDVRDDAVKYGRKRYKTLVEVAALSRESAQAFEAFVSRQPQDAQRAFRLLLQQPEALSAMTDNIDLTKRIGAMYRNDPAGLTKKTDAMHAEAVKRRDEEVRAWKQTLENDAQARVEFEMAARDYWDQYRFERGIAARRWARMHALGYYGGYAVRPYSYWFGYPSWYARDYWYPNPYWYDLGFYYGPAGELIVFDYPSPYFTSWYFYDPMNVYYYPSLCNGFVEHYYGHRGYTTAGNVPVENWVQTTKDKFNGGLAQDPNQRLQQIRHFGEQERAATLNESPQAVSVPSAAPQRETPVEAKREVLERPSDRVEAKRSMQAPRNAEPMRRGMSEATSPHVNLNRNGAELHQKMWERQNPSVQPQRPDLKMQKRQRTP